MRFLLDTHTWVWWNMHPKKLSRKVTKLIENIDGYDDFSCLRFHPSSRFPNDKSKS